MQTTDLISTWGPTPETDRSGKITLGQTFNQARGFSEAAYREGVKTNALLEQILAELKK